MMAQSSDGHKVVMAQSSDGTKYRWHKEPMAQSSDDAKRAEELDAAFDAAGFLFGSAFLSVSLGANTTLRELCSVAQHLPYLNTTLCERCLVPTLPYASTALCEHR